jgi:outer membrane usher protein
MRKAATFFLHLPVLVALLLTAFPVQPQEAETVILKVVLNTQDMGDHFLVITDSGDPLFTTDELRKLGLVRLPPVSEVEVGGKHYVSLRSLAPQVTHRLDEINATLHIETDPDFLGTSTLDLTYRRPDEVIHKGHTSGFVNYGLFYNLTNDFDFNSLSVPIEAGLSIGGRFLAANFSYTKRDRIEDLVRLMTSFTTDNTSAQRRFIVGDFASYSGELGGGGIFGGISVTRQFSITPRFVSSPGLDLYGVIETPSELEIYVDNRLVETRHLPPGGYEFLNVPANRGAGEVTLLVRDAFGREAVQAYPFYLSTALLKAGLHEYSYNLGFRREEFGLESFQYGDLAFLGFHRLGITDNFTAGLRAEASDDLYNLGAGFAFTSVGFGEVAVSIAASRDDGRSGNAGGLTYIYRGRNFNGQFAIRGFSRDYATLSLSSATDRARYAGSLGLGYSPLFSGSVSMQLAATDYYSGQDMKRLSLSYTRRIFRAVSLFIRASRIDIHDVDNEIEVGFMLPLGSARSAGMNYANRAYGSVATAYLSKNAPPNVGYGYRFQVDTMESPKGGIDINRSTMFTWRGSRGVFSATYRNANKSNYYNLGFSGSVAFIDRSVYLSRPITDSFALVKVGDIEGVRVRRSNQDIGMTDEKGEFLVPDLISYYDNRLSIDDKDIPVNYELKELAQHVAPPLRGGTVVSFDIRKLQAFVGQLFILTRDEKTAAEYWGLELDLPHEKRQAIVGKDAQFYLENVPAGEWPARLYQRERECFFVMAIPQSESMVVEMGEVICEID